MSTAGLETLDHSVQLAHEWINELDATLAWGNKHRSWQLLRAVLQTLRDCLPVAEGAHFASQLPLILRGVYYEHWRPAGQAARGWDRDRFFARVQEQFSRDPIEDVGDAIEAVFDLLECHISEGEIAHVIGCLPNELRTLWPGQ
jgi:uncharacterized protein (DUF2267 family)